MEKQEVYRIPTIDIENKEDLIKILSENKPACIFEHIEEVTNPVGFQWNYILTAKITSENLGIAIILYKESFFEYPNIVDGIIAVWLKDAIPGIRCWYRGKLTP